MTEEGQLQGGCYFHVQHHIPGRCDQWHRFYYGKLNITKNKIYDTNNKMLNLFFYLVDRDMENSLL